jgi:superfamily II DNA or RNA helicase
MAITERVRKEKQRRTHQDFLEAIKGINTVIIDEVHMAKADVLKRLLTGPFRTLWHTLGTDRHSAKADYEFMGLKCSIGDVTHRIQASELQDKGVLANCHVNVLQTQDHPQFKTYAEELKWLTTDKVRMAWVAKTIKDVATSGNTLDTG